MVKKNPCVCSCRRVFTSGTEPGEGTSNERQQRLTNIQARKEICQKNMVLESREDQPYLLRCIEYTMRVLQENVCSFDGTSGAWLRPALKSTLRNLDTHSYKSSM